MLSQWIALPREMSTHLFLHIQLIKLALFLTFFLTLNCTLRYHSAVAHGGVYALHYSMKLNVYCIKMYGAACRTPLHLLIVLRFIAASNVVNVKAVFHFTSFTPLAGLCGNKMNMNSSGRGIESCS